MSESKTEAICRKYVISTKLPSSRNCHLYIRLERQGMLKYRKGACSLIASMGVWSIGAAVGFSVKQILLYD